MIINLFSLFDPSTNILNLRLNWLSSIIIFLFFPFSFWLSPNNFYLFYNKVIQFLFNEFKIILNNNKLNSFLLFFISLLIIILLNNYLRLYSYIFTATRHLIFNLSIALPLWFRFLIFGWINKINHIFAHLVPQRTPYILIPFIICIELIRNIIRPITLTVRLTANIIAGHLLLTLLGNLGPMLFTSLLPLLLIVQLLLFSLELAVAIIQSYVFSILRILYFREV
jgi:F-type H+-transporting ATPase subunit a